MKKSVYKVSRSRLPLSVVQTLAKSFCTGPKGDTGSKGQKGSFICQLRKSRSIQGFVFGRKATRALAVLKVVTDCKEVKVKRGNQAIGHRVLVSQSVRQLTPWRMIHEY